MEQPRIKAPHTTLSKNPIHKKLLVSDIYLIIRKVFDVNAELVQFRGYILIKVVQAISACFQAVQKLPCVLSMT